ncbi:MAG: mannose-1-phosphate guanylyltransferase [Candidatus Levybacteria bacterium]|nr:mannose-1-phosphate guanylyltransferase [Candidatus Levybacteria bacterium]
MKIVIFAGGVGTRLWPLSRKNTPKQFEKIFGDKSTLQETVDRLMPAFSPSDIYVATGKRYENIVRKQLDMLPSENLIFEPEMRDVGPAIGLVASILEKQFPKEPVAILWSDHLVKHVDTFKSVLKEAEKMVLEKGASFVFIAQKPRFANQNMGWIEVGDLVDKGVASGLEMQTYRFHKLRYRPTLEEAKQFYQNSNFVWNLGYFVTTPQKLTSLYRSFVPVMYETLMRIRDAWNTPEYETILSENYPKLEKISFDDAILVKLNPDNMYVISCDLGWSDVGAWEALKEALAASVDENVTKGTVTLEDSRDTLAFNYVDQLVVGIDLDEMLVVNTEDVLLVCPKTSVPKIKKLVESLAGTPHEHLT